jgi:hypothetical protein
VASKRTEVLFVALTFLGCALFAWRAVDIGSAPSTVILFCLFSLFLFYSLNYRVLVIRITPGSVKLKFGIFKWSIPLGSIERCYLDDASLWRIAGAGIHFTFRRKRYRAMFNFLEHQRVVILLSRKKGLVREIAFSTRQPEEVMRVITTLLTPQED